MEVYSSDSDTSDDEHARNTVGRIPLEWYDDYEHVGYDLDGRKVRTVSIPSRYSEEWPPRTVAETLTHLLPFFDFA